MNSNPPFTSRLRIPVAVLLVLAAGVAFVPDAQAQTSLTWTGTTDGSWGTAANWGGTTPTYGTTTDITFGNSNTNTNPSFLGAASTIRSLNFNEFADGNVTIRLGTASSGGSNAVLTFSSTGTSNLTVAPGATGNFTIGNGIGSITLGSNLLVDHNGNGTLTIDRPLTSTGGITKNGTGTLVLSGTNTFTGGLRINTGTVTGTVAGAMGTASNTVTFGGAGAGVLNLQNDTNTTFTALMNVASANGTVLVNRATSGAGVTHGMGGTTLGGGYELSVRGGSNVASGTQIFGAGMITMAGDGSIALLDNLSGLGDVRLTNSGGTTGTGNLIIKKNASSSQVTLDSALINHNGTITFSGSGSGTTRIGASGAGGVGSNVTGITVNGTAIALAVGTAFSVNSAGTTLTAQAGTITVSSGITGSGNLTLRNDGSTAGGITIQTASVNNIGTITNSGSGTGSVSISGGVGSNVTGITQNSSTSGLTISTTALTVSNPGTTLTSQNGTLTISSGITGTGNLILRNDGSTANGITISANTVNNTGTITSSGSGTGSVSISGGVGSNVTGITQNSANSTLSLSTANTYGGNLTILSGTVSGSSSATVFSTGAILLGDTSGINNATLTSSFVGTHTNNITVRSGSSGTLSITGVTNNTTLSGTLALNNNLTVDHATTSRNLTLSGAITQDASARTITKGTGVGTVEISGATTLGAGGLTLANSGSAVFTHSGGITGTGNLILNNNNSTANGITISANTVNNTGTITNSGSGTGSVLISSAIGANVTRVVQNSATSTLTLSGANTYSGGTTVSAGVLSIASTSALPSWNTNGGYSVASGASLAVYNAVTDANITTMLGTTNFAAGSAIGFDTTTADRTYSAALGNTAQGALGLTKTGSNSLILTGDSTYTGATTINGGTLQLGNNGTTGSISASSIITINSGTLTINRSDVTTIANRIFLGNGSQRISIPSNTSTFTGDISSLAGATSALTLLATNTSAINVSGNITVNGSVSLANSSPYLTLSGNNSASSWTVSSAYVQLSSVGAMGYSGNISMTGGGLIFTNNSTDVSSRIVIGSGQTYRLAAASSNSFTINSALTANGTNALIAGISGAAGTLVLGNSNSSFTGAVTIDSGTLSVAGIGNAGSNSYLGTNSSIVIGSKNTPGTLLYTGTGETTDKGITVAGGQGARIFADNPSGTLRFTSNVTSTFLSSLTFLVSGTGMGEIAGSIGENGTNLTSVTKSGTGIWTLSGNNTYTGATSVSDGILVFRNTSAKSTGAVTATASGSIGLGVGGTGDFSDANVQTLFNTGNLLVNSSNITLNAASGVALDTTAGNFNQSSALTAARALTKLGNNTLTLGNGSNSYSGATTIAAGTLSVASIGNTGSNSSVGSGSAINIGLRDSSGTLLYTGAAQTTNRTINLSGTTGGAVIDQSGSGLLRFTSAVASTGNGNKTLTLQGSTSGTGELSGVISDFAANTATTALVKAGTGTWTLSGTNTYTGGTTLSAGVLGINATAALGATGNITFSGGTMQFASGGSGANYGDRIKNSASAIILDTNGQSVTFSTAVDNSNTLGLTKNGTGTLSLSAANTYTGGTTINAGTLALSGASGSVAGTIAVNTGAALQLAHTADTSLSNNISGVGNIVHPKFGS